jgi:hypothetical protein
MSADAQARDAAQLFVEHDCRRLPVSHDAPVIKNNDPRACFYDKFQIMRSDQIGMRRIF